MSNKSAFSERQRSEWIRQSRAALSALKPGEHLFMTFVGEESQFLRVGATGGSAKVRQVGTVEDSKINLTLVLERGTELRKGSLTVGLEDDSVSALAILRADVAQLPPDPFARKPEFFGRSEQIERARLLPASDAPEALLSSGLAGLDGSGIYASGSILRGQADSAGNDHWFETESWSFDFSLYTPGQRAVKSTLAGKDWDPSAFARGIAEAKTKLALMEIPARKIARGSYRTYLAPAAVADLVGMFSWAAIGENAIREAGSPLRLLRSGERSLSPKFSLSEDFRSGTFPRFTPEGEVAPEVLPLIREGKLVNSLVSSRSAKEYGIVANGAATEETLRSPAIATGDLPIADAARRLGEGLYLSNLHYLNWSDLPGGRVTGMTRFACFWVEGGQIVSPIENLRWDDTLFEFFGDALEAVTRESELQPEIATYQVRHPGGFYAPGMLLSRMKFTL